MSKSLCCCRALAWVPGQHLRCQINYAFIFRSSVGVCSKLVENLSMTIKGNARIWGLGTIAKNIRDGVTEGPYVDTLSIAVSFLGPHLWGQSVYRTYAGVLRDFCLDSLSIVANRR